MDSILRPRNVIEENVAEESDSSLNTSESLANSEEIHDIHDGGSSSTVGIPGSAQPIGSVNRSEESALGRQGSGGFRTNFLEMAKTYTFKTGRDGNEPRVEDRESDGQHQKAGLSPNPYKEAEAISGERAIKNISLSNRLEMLRPGSEMSKKAGRDLPERGTGRLALSRA